MLQFVGPAVVIGAPLSWPLPLAFAFGLCPRPCLGLGLPGLLPSLLARFGSGRGCLGWSDDGQATARGAARGQPRCAPWLHQWCSVGVWLPCTWGVLALVGCGGRGRAGCCAGSGGRRVAVPWLWPWLWVGHRARPGGLPGGLAGGWCRGGVHPPPWPRRAAVGGGGAGRRSAYGVLGSERVPGQPTFDPAPPWIAALARATLTPLGLCEHRRSCSGCSITRP